MNKITVTQGQKDKNTMGLVMFFTMFTEHSPIFNGKNTMLKIENIKDKLKNH